MKIYCCSEKNTRSIPRSNLIDDEKGSIDFGGHAILFQQNASALPYDPVHQNALGGSQTAPSPAKEFN